MEIEIQQMNKMKISTGFLVDTLAQGLSAFAQNWQITRFKITSR